MSNTGEVSSPEGPEGEGSQVKRQRVSQACGPCRVRYSGVEGLQCNSKTFVELCHDIARMLLTMTLHLNRAVRPDVTDVVLSA